MTDDVLDRAQQALNVRRPCPECGLTDCAWQEYARLNRIGDIAPELIDALRAARTENEQLREEADRWQSMWRQDLDNADTAMRERDKANTENERMYGFIHRLGHIHTCEHPHAAPGDTWQCPNCQRTWKAHEWGPLDIRWETTR